MCFFFSFLAPSCFTSSPPHQLNRKLNALIDSYLHRLFAAAAAPSGCTHRTTENPIWRKRGEEKNPTKNVLNNRRFFLVCFQTSFPKIRDFQPVASHYSSFPSRMGFFFCHSSVRLHSTYRTMLEDVPSGSSTGTGRASVCSRSVDCWSCPSVQLHRDVSQ